MVIRVEGEHGSERTIVSIDGRGVLRIHFCDKDTGHVREQWTEEAFTRAAEHIARVGALVKKARHQYELELSISTGTPQEKVKGC